VTGTDEYGPSTYGDRIADIYDDSYPELPTEQTVDFLAELAGPGPVLELAIGTGRIALPLAARGVEVHGIDASEAMVARLREKPGGDRIPVTMGEMSEVAVEGRYPLVYLVFNTFFGLLTQEDQVRCFRNVAARLTDGGVFVLEAFVPDLSRFDRGQRVSTDQVGTDRVRINVDRHRPIEQRVDSAHVLVSEEGVKIYPVRIRYAFPPELDLMAQLAGLRLRERFGGWLRQPFDEGSGQHVSVYELAPR
jgi:SAM-dependent methyltransferase